MRTTRYVTAIAVIAALLCSGACGSSSDDPDPTPSTTVSGAVVNGDQFTQVTYTPTGGGTPVVFTCAADGTYGGDLPAGIYATTASRPGYEDDGQSGVDVADSTNTVVDFDLAAVPANEYIGSESCAVCHQDYYDTFRNTAHPYKINKVVNGQAPSYPFSALPADIISRIDDDGAVDPKTGLLDPNGTETDNVEGTPGSWADVSYVIGGYFWKARFIDLAGWIVTGSATQYNYATDGMVGYHNNEGWPDPVPAGEKGPKPFNCGNCHTTGWQHYDAGDNPFRQENLAGMDGTFHAGGIQCEACHGAGSEHAQVATPGNPGPIVTEATPRTEADFMDGSFAYGKAIACGECHTRDGEADYPGFVSAYNLALDAVPLPRVPMGGRIAASGGLVKHHEQYDEILGVDPDTLLSTRDFSPGKFMDTHGKCQTCHTDPHLTTLNRAISGDAPGVDASNTFCMNCHADKDPMLRTGGMKTLACVDCHMPAMAKSAVATPLANGVVEGDVTSHIFGIKLGTAVDQFTGSFSYPYITADWACRICHGNDGLDDLPALGVNLDTYVFHNN